MVDGWTMSTKCCLKMKMWVSFIITAVLCVSGLEATYCEIDEDCGDGGFWDDMCCDNECNTIEECTGIDEDTFKGLMGLGIALTIIIPLLCCLCCCGCIGTGVYFFMRSRRNNNVQGAAPLVGAEGARGAGRGAPARARMEKLPAEAGPKARCQRRGRGLQMRHQRIRAASLVLAPVPR